MPPFLLRLILICLALMGPGTISRGGMTADTPYTIRGQIDFDTVLQLLNPYGTWSKVGEKWAYTPLDHGAPYTSGRWIYTEYGWYWKGTRPHSWVTEHYGYWKRNADKIWSWYPGPYWLPQIVEIRATDKYLGWRSAEVDDDGNFVEAPIDRFSKTDEWVFVTLAQFANPITPGIVAPLDVTRAQLEESTECRHTYLTYREIDRPGPHPADFADLSKDGGMLAPKTMRDESTAQMPAPPITNAPATNSPAAKMTGTNQPALIGTEINPAADTRKVKYWVTMSLPTFWTKPPADAKVDEIYIYRPDFFQDQDGIERRITLWFNPNARTSLKDVLAKHMPDSTSPASTASSAPGSAAIPATPAVQPSHGAFRSPLDDNYRAGTDTSTKPSTNSASSKSLAPSGAKASVPDGLAAPGTQSN
jgi:hypothetical protein